MPMTEPVLPLSGELPWLIFQLMQEYVKSNILRSSTASLSQFNISANIPTLQKRQTLNILIEHCLTFDTKS